VLLAIETASGVGGIALCDGDELLGERTLGGIGARHAAELLPAIDSLLRGAGRTLADVERIALSVGPGSFTGLRIGLATALGLCFATERSITPVPTLAALSLQAEDAECIVPLLDARRGQVYTGLYGPGGEGLAADRVVDPLPWFQQVAEQAAGRLPVLLGTGACLYQNEIRSTFGEQARVLGREAAHPLARDVARLAREASSMSPDEVELCYLRRSEAEEKRLAGHLRRDPIF
jgi:tRNA threonylcarbamoyladenosine biosynthesis protein TsaB